jgi:hypothetical protein
VCSCVCQHPHMHMSSYIQTADERISDPCAMVHDMLSALVASSSSSSSRAAAAVPDMSQGHSRYSCRILPLLDTCQCTVESFARMCEPIVRQYSSKKFLSTLAHIRETGKQVNTFAIVVQRRAKDLTRKQLIDCIASVAAEGDANLTVDLKNPDVTFVCVVDYQFAGLSVLFDYNRLRQYNAQQLLSKGVDPTC